MTQLSRAPRVGGLAKAALLVAGVTVLARLAGFARVLVFAHTVGPTCLGDTYYTANTLPNVIFDIVAGGALSSIVVPVLAGPVAARDDETADRIASALLTWTLLLLMPVLVAGLFLTRPLMDVLVGNGHPGCVATHEQIVGARMLVVFMPQVLLYGVGIVLTGVLQSHRRFLGPAIGPLLSSLVVIAVYVLFAATANSGETTLVGLTRGHELILSVGTTLGVAALVLPLLIPLQRSGRRLRPTLSFPPNVAAHARRLAVAGAVVLGSQDIATVVILRLANDRGASGAVVLYNLAWTVFLVPWAVLALPIATAAFPTLTARWQSGDRAGYATTASATLRAVIVATAGAAGVVIATSAPVARVLVVGAPGGVAPHILARTLAAFAPGLVGFSVLTHASRVHYARGDARSPAVAMAAGWFLVVVADIVLVVAMPREWTAAALGIGSSIGLTAAGAWLAFTLRRPVGLPGAAATTRAAVVAGVLSAGSAYLVAHALPEAGLLGSAAATLLVALLCLGVYTAVVAVMDRPTLSMLFHRRYV